MIRIIVKYDKHTRTFKLLDREFGSLLEHGAEYEVLVEMMFDGLEQESFFFEDAPLAHA